MMDLYKEIKIRSGWYVQVRDGRAFLFDRDHDGIGVNATSAELSGLQGQPIDRPIIVQVGRSLSHPGGTITVMGDHPAMVLIPSDGEPWNERALDETEINLDRIISCG